MALYLWKYLWKKTQSSLHYVKIALCAIAVYFLILSIFTKVFQTNRNNLYRTKTTINNSNDIRAFISDKKLNSSTSGRLTILLYRGIACSLVGEACYDNLDKKNPSNISTFIASIFAYPFLNPPASGIGATVQTLAQAGLIPKSYAAEGVGFASISPLIGVWKAMRDIAYLLLVLVIVTIGFMIMLRTKINPQTVVKAENALPKIIISLIYITFSFAIAGFLIDLMYVSIVLIIAILGPQQTTKATKDWMTLLLQAKPGALFSILINFDIGMIFNTLPNAILSILGGWVGNALRLFILIASSIFVNPYVGRALAFITKPDIEVAATAGVVVAEAELRAAGLAKAVLELSRSALGIGISIAIGIAISLLLLGVIILLTVVMLFFRIFLLLFSNYIKLLVLIIISPLYLLMEAIPGQSTFSSWIRNLVELLIPYPVIIATFLIGSVIIETSTAGTLWTPPFLYDINPKYLSAIVGMWILFMIPDFIGIVQKKVNSKPLPLDAGLGTFFGGAKSGVETGLGEMSKYALLAGQFAPLGRLYEMIPGFKKK